ncbi:hypothetical protein ACNF49_35135 [Actinomadura sp. ATCC 39365]|uniref:hypothetical protein n=1 Tax=Nonomuraea sp. NPDC005692 TaxID=3157168 RepID=UPI0033C95B8B
MLTTRSARASRPPASGAGRWWPHAMLALALLISVVFAHGGACAAVELSERAQGGPAPSVQGAHPDVHRHVRWLSGRMPVRDAGCLHGELPPGHLHGTEQECAATAASAPAVTAVPVLAAGPAAVVAGPVRPAPRAASRQAASGQENSRVMRI